VLYLLCQYLLRGSIGDILEAPLYKRRPQRFAQSVGCVQLVPCSQMYRSLNSVAMVLGL
jgi:hypothetical protein